MSTKLLPCPFCGGKAEICEVGDKSDFYFRCSRCCLSNLVLYDTEKEAIEAWNKRVYPKDVKEAINKQVPMKPEVVKDALDQTRFFCGKCGGQVDDVASIELTGKFCCLCGQKIDWKNKDLG